MPKKNPNSAAAGQPVSDYRHEDAKRKNNPPAGLAAHGPVRPAPKLEYAYDSRASTRPAAPSSLTS
ncbi:MAG: hypothetical protein HY703_03510 [Gemmatimonadetes bacterium]|nr:hypothetical protein [Gemmatimonadota bacterium]